MNGVAHSHHKRHAHKQHEGPHPEYRFNFGKQVPQPLVGAAAMSQAREHGYRKGVNDGNGKQCGCQILQGACHDSKP